MNKIKAGKAPGVCGIYPEYIQHGGSDALRTLHKIVTQVWKEEGMVSGIVEFNVPLDTL